MTWVNETLAEFGRQVGLPGFCIGMHGVARLTMESGAQLAVEPVRRDKADEILIYFTQPLGFDADVLRRRALEKVYFSNGGPFPLQLATRGDGSEACLIMLTRLPEREFTVQLLGRVADYFDRWFAELRNGY